ncbi:hypothetical protein F2Y18_15785 [Bacillus cereus]|uniref:hypothetical protein n=1 Tax=Bacillus cereus TaxID=1396 RepID=UPI00122F57F1|nr:hypothetical protein [Bacillus cereus]KAA2396105.1 hypothetical protein F2Y18_15785 [Bacillus cereus]
MNDPIYDFIKGYQLQTNVQLTTDDLLYEIIWLYRDEIDEALIPLSILETLNETVVTSSIIFVDGKGDEYMRIAIFDEQTQEYDKFVGWFINYEPIDWGDNNGVRISSSNC